jgi:hypothetical protein
MTPTICFNWAMLAYALRSGGSSRNPAANLSS